MLRSKRHIFKKIIHLELVLLCLVLIGSIIDLFGYTEHSEKLSENLHEKTTFTAQETNILWSELGLEYIDLDISKAYFNRNNRLYVVSEGFDSIEAEIEYLKQFEGNENVHKDVTFDINTATGHNDKTIYEIYDIKCADKGYFTNCYTYEENGKYYLKFYVREARGRDLYEMFGFYKK